MHRLLAYCLDWDWVGWRSEMRSGEGFSFICTCIVTSTRTSNRTSTIARTRTNDLTILNTSTSSSDYTGNNAHTSNITVMSKRTRTVSTTGTTIMTSSTASSSTHTIFRDLRHEVFGHVSCDLASGQPSTHTDSSSRYKHA